MKCKRQITTYFQKLKQKPPGAIPVRKVSKANPSGLNLYTIPL